MINSIKNYQNVTCAKIVAQLISDGHLQRDRRNLISFYSKEIYEIETFEEDMKNTFNLNSLKYTDKRSQRYKLFFNSKDVADILNRLGVPSGNKTNCVFEIPKWILNANKKIKSAFLSGIFDCEGYVYSTNLKNNKKKMENMY